MIANIYWAFFMNTHLAKHLTYLYHIILTTLWCGNTIIPILQEGEVTCLWSHSYPTTAQSRFMWHIIPPGKVKGGLGGAPKPWVSSGSGLEERNRASSRSWVTGSPRLNGKTVMQWTIFPQMAKNKKKQFFVWFQKELAEFMYYSHWNHTLLTACVL